MLKRPHDDCRSDSSAKRPKFTVVDRLSSLSDELLLRALSFVPIPSLTVCQRCVCTASCAVDRDTDIRRVSRRFKILAGDSQLWKSAYYNRFVRPRASRIPGVKDPEISAHSLLYSSRISKWLEEDHLVQLGKETDWKKQYKLRHNWARARGSCDISEVQVAETPSVPPLLVRLHEGIVITADSTAGLRAWSMKGEQRLLASQVLRPLHADKKDSDRFNAPTSLSIDSQVSAHQHLSIAIGFVNGGFSLYQLRIGARHFFHQYTHSLSSSGIISAIAYASPYLLTMTEAQLLSVYCFTSELNRRRHDARLDPPRLLSSLKSHTVWPPLSLSIRVSPTSITASVAYAMPTYFSGWSVGLQELRIIPEGTISESRLACAVTQGFTSLWSSSDPSFANTQKVSPSMEATEIGSVGSSTKPTSLSYSHPYLLASHPDNTLTLYLVTSTASSLSIGTGSRLWGHTSSVSGAHVGDRGKAVSVSCLGDELRIWELEGGISSASSRRRMAAGEASVQVRPESSRFLPDTDPGSASLRPTAHGSSYESASGHSMYDQAMARGWVGFDDEKVIVLREKGQGTQALVIYDFT